MKILKKPQLMKCETSVSIEPLCGLTTSASACIWQCRSDFPSLSSSGTWGVKNSPAKWASGGTANRQKMASSRSADFSISPSVPNGQSKGRKDASSKHSG